MAVVVDAVKELLQFVDGQVADDLAESLITPGRGASWFGRSGVAVSGPKRLSGNIIMFSQSWRDRSVLWICHFQNLLWIDSETEVYAGRSAYAPQWGWGVAAGGRPSMDVFTLSNHTETKSWRRRPHPHLVSPQ
jgi:hypothetical protein